MQNEAIQILAGELEKHRPGKSKEAYLRASFIGFMSLRGILEKVVHDESITYTNEELIMECERMLKAYFLTL